MGIQLAPIEGTPFAGGTATGIIYLDAHGLQRTDGPTWDGTKLQIEGTTSGGTVFDIGRAGAAANQRLLEVVTDGSYDGAGFVSILDSLHFEAYGGNCWLSSNASSGYRQWHIKPGTSLTFNDSTYVGWDSTDTYTIGAADIRLSPVSAGRLKLTSDGSALGQFDVGLLTAVAPAATDVPLTLTAHASQSGNLVEVNTSAGSGGDVFLIDKDGDITASGDVKIDKPAGGNTKLIFEPQAGYSSAINFDQQGGVNNIAIDNLPTRWRVYNWVAGAEVLSVDHASNALTVTPDATFSGSTTNQASDSTGGITRQRSEEVHTLAAAATSDTTTISVPSGARLLGVLFNVDTAVTDDGGDDTWSAAFVTGSTTTLATGIAAAQNTKHKLMLPDEISTGVCQVRFTANGGSFSAGVIEVVAFYETLTDLANA